MPNFDLIVRNGRIAHRDGSISEGDIACRNGRIERIDSQIDCQSEVEIAAEGLLVLPGAIDAQVHFRDPGFPHKEDLASGSRAAVRGGVTSFLEMPNTNPPTISQETLNKKLDRAAKCSVANYGFFIGATPDNLDVINNASPACGIKIFMGSSTGNLLVHKFDDLHRIFSCGSRLIAVHAEDEDRLRKRFQRIAGEKDLLDIKVHSKIRDDQCALLATQRATELAISYKRRLHVLHLTSAVEVDYLRKAKTGYITVECTPNHLFLTEEDYDRMGSLVQMNPPIRTAADQSALWDGLHDGTIDFIATDHAPHTLQEKAQPYPQSPSGIPGVENSLPLMLTAWKEGQCTLAQVLKWMCWKPAEAYRIPRKGELKEGYDADITIVDVDSYRTVRDSEQFTKVKWSPFRGKRLTGRPVWTIVGGQIAFANNQVQENSRGKAIQYGLIQADA